MSEEKSAGKALEEKLLTQKKNGLLKTDAAETERADAFCEGYMKFLDDAKTEREAVTASVALAEANGFTPYEFGKVYQAGEKVYLNVRGKSLILAVIGKNSLENGVRLLAAHIDSPRLDLKQHPLYETSEFALLKTHYYGGVRKYQWVTIPLALHGVIYKADGSGVTVNIGEDDSDPVFTITDLLPHLAQEQSKRTLADGIKGEELNVLIGSRPFRDDDVSEKIKLNVMKILNEKYGVTEDDFVSAELEIVPSFKAKNVGLDCGLIGAYGQDDRVCAYPALEAILDCDNPEYTAVAVLTDKEEIGSVGPTGLNSDYLRHFLESLADMQDVPAYTVIRNSKCLSADVTAAFDPTFTDVHDPKNASYCNYGLAMCKFTGSRGKSGCNDASAEFVSQVRRVFDENGVIWQTTEPGRVDLGGGGTVAAYIGNMDIEVVDVGVPVLCMHSPFEVTSKLDVYMAYKGFSAFIK